MGLVPELKMRQICFFMTGYGGWPYLNGQSHMVVGLLFKVILHWVVGSLHGGAKLSVARPPVRPPARPPARPPVRPPTQHLPGWLIGWLGCMAGLAAWLPGWAGWVAGWLHGSLSGGLGGWLAGWLAVWLADRLVGLEPPGASRSLLLLLLRSHFGSRLFGVSCRACRRVTLQGLKLSASPPAIRPLPSIALGRAIDPR